MALPPYPGQGKPIHARRRVTGNSRLLPVTRELLAMCGNGRSKYLINKEITLPV
jgi:hypothetical protein